METELAKRSEKHVDYRISEFSFLFGDCQFLLIPYIITLDYIFGPILYDFIVFIDV